MIEEIIEQLKRIVDMDKIIQSLPVRDINIIVTKDKIEILLEPAMPFPDTYKIIRSLKSLFDSSICISVNRIQPYSGWIKVTMEIRGGDRNEKNVETK